MTAPPLCPMCRKAQAAAAFRPFCSRRCADVDLHGWLSNRYAVAAVEDETAPPDSEDAD